MAQTTQKDLLIVTKELVKKAELETKREVR